MLKKSTLLLGSCLAALSVSSVVFAQDADEVLADTFAAIGVSIGVGVLDLPDIATGVYSSGSGSFDPTSQEVAFGPQVGLNIGGNIGGVGSLDVFAGLSLVGTLASSSDTVIDTFSGPGVVSIQSFSPGTATFDLDTTRTGAAASATTVNGPINVTQAAGTAGSQQLTPAAGVIYYGAQTIIAGTDAAAYAGAADVNGFSFLGVGDLDGLKVTTNVSENVLYAGGDIYIGLGGRAEGNTPTYFQAYLGPTARHLGRDLTSKIAVDIPEVPGQPVGQFFDIGLTRTEELNADYLGGFVGLGVTHVDEETGVSVTVAGEGGLYAYRFDYSGRESFTIGSNVIQSNTVISEQNTGSAWFARGQVAVNLPMRQGSTLTLGGSAEYLSKVPGIDRSQGPVPVVSQIGNDHDADSSSVAGANNNSHLSISDMWNFGLTAAWTTPF